MSSPTSFHFFLAIGKSFACGQTVAVHTTHQRAYSPRASLWPARQVRDRVGTCRNAPNHWVVDPDDPRATPLEIWEQLSSEQRARIVDSLPSEFEASEAQPPREATFIYASWFRIQSLEGLECFPNLTRLELESRSTTSARVRQPRRYRSRRSESADRQPRHRLGRLRLVPRRTRGSLHHRGPREPGRPGRHGPRLLALARNSACLRERVNA